MAFEFLLDQACGPKKEMGEGELELGTYRLINCAKSKFRLEALRAAVPQATPLTDDTSVQIDVFSPDGAIVSHPATVGKLREKAESLKTAEGACRSCPANNSSQVCGCYGVISYPISSADEAWLMAQLKPLSDLGGIICSQAIPSFQWTGEPIARARARGLFESQEPVVRDLGGFTVTSDQVLQAVMAVGPALQPQHCAIWLSWFGAIRVDGKEMCGTRREDLGPLLAINPDERRRRTEFSISSNPGLPIFHFMKAAYLAWRENITLHLWP